MAGVYKTVEASIYPIEDLHMILTSFYIYLYIIIDSQTCVQINELYVLSKYKTKVTLQ